MVTIHPGGVVPVTNLINLIFQCESKILGQLRNPSCTNVVGYIRRERVILTRCGGLGGLGRYVIRRMGDRGAQIILFH